MSDSRGKQKIQTALSEFRVAIQDLSVDNDDDFLLKWLKARNYDVKKAENMLRKSMEWRHQMNIDDVLQWKAPEVLTKYDAGGPGGFDKEGRPIWLDLSAYSDYAGMVKCVTMKDLLRFEAQAIERIRELCALQSKKLGKKIHQAVVIMDMGNLSMHHMWSQDIPIFNQVMAMVEANYPEMLDACYVIKAPRIFPMAYNLVKPLLSEETKKKIKILGGDWKERLLELIDADQLPVHWGGTRRGPDGDEYCRPEISIGGKIPEHYYASTEHGLDDQVDQLETVTVYHGKTHAVPVDVKKAGSVLRWHFTTTKHDIGFGISFEENQSTNGHRSKPISVVATETCNSHLVPQIGAIVCEHVGTYFVTFDNHSSWMNNKKVVYKIEICESSEI